ncbi:trypsin-2-like [Macrosteles quadrilineatus]|uniref:trypsin-2-like n=1 Tax=Macrosteles quadrilineatus TaxID=74068 RepID=UPI0023E2D70F|nr:trypsin-2-like [Macrosteles quadrilineatus]
MLYIQTLTILMLILRGVFSLKLRHASLHVISIEEAPYLALVLSTNSKHFCTGTIVNESWVLTAAHCFYDVRGRLTEDDNSVVVVAGTDSLANAAEDIKNEVAQIRKSEKLIVHSSYHFSSNFIADLALVQLDAPLNMTKRTQTAPLDIKAVETEEGTSSKFSGTVYGFGKILTNTSHANDGYIKKQTFMISKRCKCLSRLWALSYHMDVLSSNTLMCDVVGEDYPGLCSGDQGGPLISNNFLRGVATTTLYYKDRSECQLQNNPNECGSTQTMNLFSDLCFYSQWLTYYVPQYPLVDEFCEPYTDE